jgi:hypothetical protein
LRKYRIGRHPSQASRIRQKLTGAEISALFGGATMTFQSYAHPNLVSVTTTFDLNNHTQTGTWEAPAVKKKGDVKGFVEVKGDQWCFKPESNKEFCNFVYTDGDDIYEVSSSNVVVAKERNSRLAAVLAAGASSPSWADGDRPRHVHGEYYEQPVADAAPND